MKRKHYSLTTLGVIVSAFIVSAYLGEKAMRPGTHTTPLPQFKPLPNTFVPSAASLKEMERLERKMGKLLTPPVDKRNQVDLILFGHRSEGNIFASTADMSISPPVQIEYNLTFSFHSQKKKFCILNGELYREGEKLSDGGHILRIESDRILVKRLNQKKWIYAKRKTI